MVPGWGLPVIPLLCSLKQPEEWVGFFYSNNSFVVSFFPLAIWRLLNVNPVVIIYLVKAQN